MNTIRGGDGGSPPAEDGMGRFFHLFLNVRMMISGGSECFCRLNLNFRLF